MSNTFVGNTIKIKICHIGFMHKTNVMMTQ